MKTLVSLICLAIILFGSLKIYSTFLDMKIAREQTDIQQELTETMMQGRQLYYWGCSVLPSGVTVTTIVTKDAFDAGDVPTCIAICGSGK